MYSSFLLSIGPVSVAQVLQSVPTTPEEKASGDTDTGILH